jgi:hypothetical protein
MGASEFADSVAESVVEEGVVDRPVVKPVQWGGDTRPYLPLHSLEGWSNTLLVLSDRIKDDDERIARYLLEAGNYIQMAVWRYDRKYAGHANGPAPGNPQEK